MVPLGPVGLFGGGLSHPTRHRRGTRPPQERHGPGRSPVEARRYAGAMTDGPAPTPPAPHRTAGPSASFVGVTASLSLVVGVVRRLSATPRYQLAANTGGGVIDRLPDDPVGPRADAPTGPCVDDVCNYLHPRQRLAGGADAGGAGRSSAPTSDIGGENRSDVIMLVHTDPRLQKAIDPVVPAGPVGEHPRARRGQDQLGVRGRLEGGGAATRRRRPSRSSAGSRSTMSLYVDLAGSRASSRRWAA